MLDDLELRDHGIFEIANPNPYPTGNMSLRYGVGGATTALAVVGACKIRSSGVKT
jgi:hypothetical protein